jgi:hypothetical protein
VLEPARSQTAIQAARDILDRFGVAQRLQHVRRYIWRGGTLGFRVDARSSRPPDVYYELTAEWEAPLLERQAVPANGHIELATKPVAEGRWVRAKAGYALRVGIDLAVPIAIYVRGARRESFVPFVDRPHDLVEHAIDADMTAYINAFLSRSRPVPEASAADAARLRKLGIA